MMHDILGLTMNTKRSIKIKAESCTDYKNFSSKLFPSNITYFSALSYFISDINGW